jgi:hypothetical protein
MDKKTLLTLAANSNLFRNLCNKLCNYRYIADDLFQEFLLYISEKPEEFLIKKYNEIQYISYCTNVIKGLNSHRLVANTLTNTKNRLAERHNYIEVNTCNLLDDDSTDFEIEFENKINKVKTTLADDSEFFLIDKTNKEIAELKGLTVRQVVYKRKLIKEKVKNEFNTTNITKA